MAVAPLGFTDPLSVADDVATLVAGDVVTLGALPADVVVKLSTAP